MTANLEKCLLCKLKISNYISLKEKNNPNSGIGIQNIRQRLKLLYPNSHDLKIEEIDGLFTVELLLKLKKIWDV